MRGGLVRGNVQCRVLPRFSLGLHWEATEVGEKMSLFRDCHGKGGEGGAVGGIILYSSH